MPRYVHIPCAKCRRDLRVRGEYLGRLVCCSHCGHEFSAHPGDGSDASGSLADPGPPTVSIADRDFGRRVTVPGVEALQDQDRSADRADQHDATSWPPREAQVELGRLRGLVRDLHEQLDESREECRHLPELRHALEMARSELDRLRPEVSRLRERAAEADRLEEELRDEHARTERLRIGDHRSGSNGAESRPGLGSAIERPGGNILPEPLAVFQVEGDGRAGWVIPGYEILGTLCDGAMGRVLKARQTSVDRIVAIKVLPDVLARDREHTERFWREVAIAARLAHPHIIATIDAGEADGRPYLVMEYVEGETIQDYLDMHPVFPERAAIRIVLALAEALGHLQRRGVIHRDVKPANVILTRDGGVKLLDLGLARPTADEDWGLTEAGMGVGTALYVSPEQVRGQIDVDIRGDIYSLGATLYHMVTGRAPYQGLTTAEVIRKLTDPKAPPTPPGAINPGLSCGLDAVIRAMMAQNREGRYRHPGDLILDLQRLLRGDRPLIAEPTTDELAVLAVGDAAEERPGPGAGVATIAGAVPAPGFAGDGWSWSPLILAPALLLVLALAVAVMLLVVR
jgi:tRNA A-37 threonylcarbamoyl transferase component Bud32